MKQARCLFALLSLIVLFLAGCAELGQLGGLGDYGNWGGSELVGEVRGAVTTTVRARLSTGWSLLLAWT